MNPVHETPVCTELLLSIYGLAATDEGIESAIAEAYKDKSSGWTERFAWATLSLERYRPNHRWRLLAWRLSWIMALVAVGVAGTWNVVDDGIHDGIWAIGLIGMSVVAVCILIVVSIALGDSLRGCRYLSVPEKEALADTMARYPYRGKVIAAWFKAYPNITLADKMAALYLPTQHAAYAKSVLARIRQETMHERDVRVMVKLKGEET